MSRLGSGARPLSLGKIDEDGVPLPCSLDQILQGRENPLPGRRLVEEPMDLPGRKTVALDEHLGERLDVVDATRELVALGEPGIAIDPHEKSPAPAQLPFFTGSE